MKNGPRKPLLLPLIGGAPFHSRKTRNQTSLLSSACLSPFLLPRSLPLSLAPPELLSESLEPLRSRAPLDPASAEGSLDRSLEPSRSFDASRPSRPAPSLALGESSPPRGDAELLWRFLGGGERDRSLDPEWDLCRSADSVRARLRLFERDSRLAEPDLEREPRSLQTEHDSR